MGIKNKLTRREPQQPKQKTYAIEVIVADGKVGAKALIDGVEVEGQVAVIFAGEQDTLMAFTPPTDYDEFTAVGSMALELYRKSEVGRSQMFMNALPDFIDQRIAQLVDEEENEALSLSDEEATDDGPST